MRASLLIALRRRLVASLHLRDSSTASKVLVLVSIDNLQRVYDTDSAIAVQQVNPVESRFTLHINHVAKVSTHKEINAVYRAGGSSQSRAFMSAALLLNSISPLEGAVYSAD
jgi:hypothetical protein